MQLEVTHDPPKRISALLRIFIILALADLGVVLLVVYAHALTGLSVLEPLLAPLGLVLVASSAGSLLLGVAYAWRAHPQHRTLIAFVVFITGATLLAHAYVISLPPAATPGADSGPVNSTFSNDQVTVTSTLSGQQLRVTVTAGGNALANVELSSGGQPLSGTGFSSPPSLAAPLQPGTSASGVWDAPIGGQSAKVNVTYQELTCYSTSSKSYGCIMDEVFYVPEAVGILNGQQCSTSTSHCHMEHPYLVPALMASGMAVFGQYNAVGWRIAPALLGSFSIPLLVGIAWKTSGSKKVAYLAGTFLALDVMFFSQSSGGLLDAPEVFFGLLALFAYLADLRLWRLDRFVLAGIFLGVAALAKETAIFMMGALLTYHLLFGDGSRKLRLASTFKVGVVVVLVFAGGLQAYDTALASQAMPTFVQHVGYMLSYGSSLTADKLACQPTAGYWCKFPNSPGGAPILPTDWVLYYTPVAYYATSVTVCPNSVNGVCQGGSYSYVSLAYYGVTNLLETWTVFVWIPLAAYAIYRHYRRPQPTLDTFAPEDAAPPTSALPGDIKLASLFLVWFLWNYLPYIALFFYGRVTYPFYFLPAVPAVALGTAYWVSRGWFPRGLIYVYLGMVFVFFFVYFPDKAFLPDWLRALIGH